MNKIITSVIILLLSSQLGTAQKLEKWIEAADSAFNKSDYYPAYRYYGVALEYDSARIDLWYKYAESARQFGALTKADEAYHIVLNSPNKSDYALLSFWIGDVKQKRGKYQLAKESFQQFLLEQEPDTLQRYRQIAENNIQHCGWALEVLAEADSLEITHLHNGINSRYSDFGATLVEDSLYFSSFKFIYEKDTMNPPRTYIKLLKSVDEGMGYPLGGDMNPDGRHVGHSAFTRDNSSLYYTICDYVNVTDIRCDIYVRHRDDQGGWGKAEKLDINIEGATTTQPSVGFDVATGSEYLYFSSDRNKENQLDIWRSRINTDGTVGQPVNLTSINTSANEATPFFHTPSQTLYFSTDGSEKYKTLGGFDIYKSSYRNGEWTSAMHLGAPINSSYNDLYYALFRDGKLAYFSSNRPDTSAIFWDEERREACCNDIYSVELDNSIDLLVYNLNKQDYSPLISSAVELYELTPEGPKLVTKLDNPNGNDFLFPLERYKKYLIKGTKPGFAPDIDTVDLTDPFLDDLDKLERKLYLTPPNIVELEAKTFKKSDNSPLINSTVELYELTPEGERLVTTKTNPSGNDFTFPLEKGKKYVIKGNNLGFFSDTDTIDLTLPNMQNIQKIQRDLHLDQALQAFTYDANNLEPLKGLTVELKELRDGEYVTVATKTNDGGNDFLFPIDKNKKYLITASKPGYYPLTDSLDFSKDPPFTNLYQDGALDGISYPANNLDTDGDGVMDAIDLNGDGLPDDTSGLNVLNLHLQPKSLDDFRDMALYFDNAVPDRRSISSTTDKTYEETYFQYVSKKDDFQEALGFPAAQQFNSFFTREVEGGYSNLLVFSERLLEFLSSGSSVTITIYGYSSPRAGSLYNERLSARRISAVINHFEAYEEGKLQPYIKNGKLKFITKARGEADAPPTVSDAINDPKNSIFEVLPSVERRVQFIEIKLSKE